MDFKDFNYYFLTTKTPLFKGFFDFPLSIKRLLFEENIVEKDEIFSTIFVGENTTILSDSFFVDWLLLFLGGFSDIELVSGTVVE